MKPEFTNLKFPNLKAMAEEAEFEEVPAGTFDKAQYEANSTITVDSLNQLGQEPEQTPFDRIRSMMRSGNTKTLKSTALEAKRTAKRKAQRKARRATR